MPPVAHSRLSPSAASRWTKCTASIGYCAANSHLIPADRGSVYADEGTRAHEWAEKVLTGQCRREDVPSEFEAVLVYTDECQLLHSRWSGEQFVEMRVPLFYLEEETGTCDYALIGDNVIHVVDLKYGAGVEVHAENNTQAAIYAQSFIKHMSMLYEFSDDMPVEIRIVQPRFRGDEPIKVWKLTVLELNLFCTEVIFAAKRILSAADGNQKSQDKLVFSPGAETCRWCPAKNICHVRASQALEPMSISTDILAAFDLLDAPEPELPLVPVLTEEQISNIYRHGKLLKSVIEEAEKFALERALAGNPLPGTKLVMGRQGNRKWVDEDEAYAKLSPFLKDHELFESKLISPSKVDKHIKENTQGVGQLSAELNKLISRSDGQPVVALSDDRRPAITAPADAFNHIPDDDQTED